MCILKLDKKLKGTNSTLLPLGKKDLSKLACGTVKYLLWQI